MGGMVVTMLVELVTNGELHAVQDGVKWSIAQVVSVTIWAPAIMEYAHAAVRGVERANEHRLFPPYGVRKDSAPEMRPESVSSESEINVY
jgi:hypothetical protein